MCKGGSVKLVVTLSVDCARKDTANWLTTTVPKVLGWKRAEQTCARNDIQYMMTVYLFKATSIETEQLDFLIDQKEELHTKQSARQTPLFRGRRPNN